MHTQLNVIIVDCSLVFRKSLKVILQNDFRANIMGEVKNADDFFLIQGFHTAHIIFIDISKSDCRGISLAKKILENYPLLRIIALATDSSHVHLKELIAAGFCGCLVKNNLIEDLDRALSKVLEGHVFFPDNITI